MTQSKLASSELNQRVSHAHYKLTKGLPEGLVNATTAIDRTGCETQHSRPRERLSYSWFTVRQRVIESLHDLVVRMLERCMMGLVEHKKTDVSAQQNVTVPKSVKEYLWRGYYDAIIG